MELNTMSTIEDHNDEKMKALWSNLVADKEQADASDRQSNPNANGGTTSSDSQVNLIIRDNDDDDDGDEAAKRRRKSTGWKNMHGKVRDAREQYTWDVCFVFKVGDEKQTCKYFDPKKGETIKLSEKEMFERTTAEVVRRAEAAGLLTNMYFSVQNDEIYCRMAVTEKRLQQEADRIDYDILLDKDKCLEFGNALGLKLAEATEKEEDLGEGAWKNLYGKYDQFDPNNAYRQELYMKWNTEDPDHPRYNSFFSSVDRLRLVWSIIEADEQLGGAGMSLGKLIENENQALIAVFPLHENNTRMELKHHWYRLKSTFSPPLARIRYYFGEKIAYYFAFLAYYNRSLIAPAIIGVIFFALQIYEGRVDVEPVPAYAVMVALWATLFLEFWKRTESRYRVKWGMTKFAQKEQPRPEFSGEWKISPIDGKRFEYFPWFKKLTRALLSQTVIWTLILVVVFSVIGIFLMRKTLQETSPTYGTYITAIVNAIQIQVLNFVYGMVAKKLNDYENHRTDTEYENALIAKSFLFKFVNSYNSLFYIAWVKKSDPFTNGCENNDCLGELQKQLGTIFISLIVINNVLEVLVPYLKGRKNAMDNAAEDGREKSTAEKEFELEEYESTFDDFDEIVIQYGYVTMFVVAFPLAPLLALLNNVAETRIDATKLCNLSRRPEPKGAANIGTWYDILEIVSFLAVITNVALVTFAAPEVSEKWFDNDATTAAYVFILSEHVIFLIKFAIAYFVPDEPEDYHIHVARQNYIVNVLINGMEEEEDEMFNEDGLDVDPDNWAFEWGRVSDTMQVTGHEWAESEDMVKTVLPEED